MKKPKKRHYVIAAASVVVLIVLIPIGCYRIPGGPPTTIVAEVHYKFVDLGGGDGLRYYYEGWVAGNRRLILVNQKPGPSRWVYLSEEDFGRCWPADIRGSAHTYEVTITVRPLFFGGESVGTLEQIRKIEKRPVISK